jgi:hypothetical protein
MKGSAFLLVALTLLVSVALDARPIMLPHLGDAGFGIQDPIDPFRYSHAHSVRTVSGRVSSIHYDIELHKEVISLDRVMDIDAILCAEDTLSLTYTSAAFLEGWTAGVTLLALGSNWGCVSQQNAMPTHIYARVISWEIMTSSEVLVRIEPVEVGALIRNGSVSLSVQHSIQAGPAEKEDQELQGTKDITGRKLSCWFCWADHIVSSVASAIKFVLHGGDLQSSKTDSEAMSFNVEHPTYGPYSCSSSDEMQSKKAYDLSPEVASCASSDKCGDGQKLCGSDCMAIDSVCTEKECTADWKLPSGMSITCSDCFAILDVTTTFKMTIEDFHLQKLSLTTEGDAFVRMQIEYDAHKNFGYSFSKEIVNDVLNGLAAITVDVGIPLTLNFYLPIFVGFQYQASADLQVTLSDNFYGSVTVGASYDASASPKLQSVFQTDFSPFSCEPSLSEVGKLSFTGNAWVAPHIQLVLEHIITLDTIVQPSLILQADFSESDNDLLSENIQDLVAEGNWGIFWSLDITTSIQLGLNFHGKEILTLENFGPENIYRIAPRKLYETSFSGSARSFPVTPTQSASMMIKSAVGTPTCPLGQQCRVASPSLICPELTGTPVCISNDAQSRIEQDINNQLAPFTHSSPLCATEMRLLLCASMMPACDIATNVISPICSDACTGAFSQCNFNSSTIPSRYCAKLEQPAGYHVVAGADDASSTCRKLPTLKQPEMRSCEVMDSSVQGICPYSSEQSHVMLFKDQFPSQSAAVSYVESLLDPIRGKMTTECLSAVERLLCSEYLPACKGSTATLSPCRWTCQYVEEQCEFVKGSVCDSYAFSDRLSDNDCSAVGVTQDMLQNTVSSPGSHHEESSKQSANPRQWGSSKVWILLIVAVFGAAGISLIALTIGLATPVLLRRYRLQSGNNGFEKLTMPAESSDGVSPQSDLEAHLL